jgi:hypothetical protein
LCVPTWPSLVAPVLAARCPAVIGLAFVGGGILAGPGPHATAVRRFLAPYLRDQAVAVYAVVAALFLLWLAFIPGSTISDRCS